MAASYITPEISALLQEDAKLWERARTKENPFDIKVPDGSYLALLSKVQLKTKAKDGKKHLVWSFLYMFIADANTGAKDCQGQQIFMRHEIVARGNATKEQAMEYFTYDLKTLGVANVKELTVNDFEDVLAGLNNRRRAVIIKVITKDGYKNGRLQEAVKMDAIKQFLTPETEAMLNQLASVDDTEAGDTVAAGGGGDALDGMDRAQLLELNKTHNLGLKTKNKSDDEVRQLLRDAIAKLEAPTEEDEDEEEGDAEPTPTPPKDLLEGLSREEMLKIKVEQNLSFRTKGEPDDVVRERLREAMRVVPADPNLPGEE